MATGRAVPPALLALLLLLGPCAARAGGRWPWDPVDPAEGKGAAAGAWSHTLELLWNKSKEHVGFCLGRSQAGALELMASSWQWPLPTGPADDALCSNRTEIELRLCGPAELEEYYKYMLLTTNPEKIPDTPQCTAGSSSIACTPGFFDANLQNKVEPVEPPQPHACCQGYFCPGQLTCMIPCPLGSYCPRAWPAPPPAEYKARGGDDSMWCAPYAYKERRPAGCGGADRWPVVPEGAFPAAWWPAGEGSIYCEGGSFCPNSTAKLGCAEGYFCRQGSMEPDRCPPGVRCPPGTNVPENGTTGITVDALLFVMLWLLYTGSKYYNKLLRRLGTKERLRITWGRQPEITVVAAAPSTPQQDGSPASRPASRVSQSGGRAAADGEQQQQHMGLAVGEEGPLSEDDGSEGQVEGGHGSLLRLLSPRREQRRRAVKAPAASPVWASFRGPEADDYEALPDEPAGEQGAELVPRRRHVSTHRRTSSTDQPEDAATPLSLHRRLLSQQRQSLLTSEGGWLHGAGPGGRRLPLSIEFRDMGLRLRSCGKVVLQGVWGQLRGGRTTAIMGPSGAGKTSLLNTLSGKAPYGVQSGEVLINGRPDRLERYKRVMGFVPQDDIMHSTLTVEENLMFAARYRLPAHYRREQHLYFVERAIQTLQLEEVRHEQIGDAETRGISGGQRKRVNVGLELVANPSLLFLDEPTSGLDSTASKALVVALQAVVQGGVTAAAVIHQPSNEIFEMFDDVLLLGKGGRTVYYGLQAGVQAYFEGLSFELPSRMNPADAYMDIISGAMLRPGQAEADVGALFDAWEEHCGRLKPPALGTLEGLDGAEAGTEDGLLLGGDGEQPLSWRARAKEAFLFGAAYLVSQARDLWEGGVELCRSVDVALLGGRLSGGGKAEEEGEGDARDVLRLARRRTPGFLPQLWWCLSRAVLKRMREPLLVFTDYSLVALTGMTLGLISDRGRSTIMHFSISVTYSTIALGMISTVGALPTFGRDKVVFFREAASGLNRLSFFLALDTFDHAGTLLRSAVYLIMWYSFAVPRAILWQMYLIVLGINYYCAGVAYLLSQVLEPASAQLSAAVLTLISTLIARESNPHGLLLLIKELSFARYGLEGQVIAESNRLTGVWLLARCADLQGLRYDVRNFGWCLLALFGLGVAFRVAAILCMLLLNRDRQR